MLKVRDFECQKCHKVFEVFAIDGSVVFCPRCDSAETVQYMSAPAGKVTGLGATDTRLHK